MCRRIHNIITFRIQIPSSRVCRSVVCHTSSSRCRARSVCYKTYNTHACGGPVVVLTTGKNITVTILIFSVVIAPNQMDLFFFFFSHLAPPRTYRQNDCTCVLLLFLPAYYYYYYVAFVGLDCEIDYSRITKY